MKKKILTVAEAGRKGGKATLKKHNYKHFKYISALAVRAKRIKRGLVDNYS